MCTPSRNPSLTQPLHQPLHQPNFDRFTNPRRHSFALRGGASDDASSDANTPPQLSTPCIGIDLGTTYSCVGVWRNNRVEICTNEQGNRITPSYVSFSANGDRLVGDAAKNQATSNPENTVFDVKRLIGRQFSESSVKKDASLFPFGIVKNSKGKPDITVTVKGEKKQMSPEEISGMVSDTL